MLERKHYYAMLQKVQHSKGDITEWEVLYLISILPLPKRLVPQCSNGMFLADTIPKIKEMTKI
jgi:hypothetical protein